MKLSLIESLKNEFNEGLLAAEDPENAYLPPEANRKTTIYSDWYTRTCPECKQKFREGDIVKLCPLCGKAYHNDDKYGLYCWSKHFANGNKCREPSYDRFNNKYDEGCLFPLKDKLSECDNYQNYYDELYIPELNQQFKNGLAVHWKSFDNLKELKVERGDSAVGLICQLCGFTIRPGDIVVKCPCNKCSSYFHNDHERHYKCWNEWNTPKRREHCIQTGNKIDICGNEEKK